MQKGTVTREPEPRAPKSQVADSEAAENHDSLPGWHGKVELCCPRTGLLCWVSLPSSFEGGPVSDKGCGVSRGSREQEEQSRQALQRGCPSSAGWKHTFE